MRTLLLSLSCLSAIGLTSCHFLSMGAPYVAESRTVKWSGELAEHPATKRRMIANPKPLGYIGGNAKSALGLWRSMTLMEKSGDKLVPWTTPLKNGTPVVLRGRMDSCLFNESRGTDPGPVLEQVLVVKQLVER